MGSGQTLDIAGGFTAVHANAAPAQCGCFYMYGGSAQVVANDASGISFVFDYGTTNTSNINGENHNLRLSTYLAGGRYTYRSQRKFSPFGQVLVGVGHSNTNFVIDKSTSTIAFSTGGGVDYDISSRFSIRIAQAEYLLTHVPNGVNNEQNQIRLTSRVVFHITKSKNNASFLKQKPSLPSFEARAMNPAIAEIGGQK
jgi:opacity protein-like surface antigen